MSIAKETLKMGKGDFSKKWANIVDAHRVNSKIIGKPKDFILLATRLVDRFSKMANDPDVFVKIKNQVCGRRKVKMVVLCRPDGREVPVGKGVITDLLYPAKRIATSASPEKKHALTVRSAMRNAVQQQLKNYRKTLQYPVECFHTGRMLRRGMRVDIDHINKPFVQLCDEFLAAQELTYCDIGVAGPPNLKRIRDDVTLRAWQLYHEIHARLAPSSARANRSAGSGTYEASEALIGSFAKEDDEDLALDF